MKGSGYKFSILLMLILFAAASFGQSEQELKNKKRKLQEEIEYTNELIKETKKNQTSSLDQLIKINKKIEVRAEIISTINDELGLLDKKIEKNKVVIATLESDLQELRKEYADMLYYTYKNRSSYNRLLFLFSSADFNQAYKRLKYLQQYTSYRKRQAQLIVKTKESINKKISILENIRTEKYVLLSSLEIEKQNYSMERIEHEGILTNLKRKEKDLYKDLRRKKRTAEKLQKAIEEIIREAIRKAREAAAKAGGSSKGFPMTPEAKKLSMNFSANKGKFPWPVLKGVKTGDYGPHEHPVLEGIIINNNGIDISTNTGAMARAIFDGVVSKVLIIPGEGKTILIRHGEYLSVYSFMSEVFVKTGDKIITKQELGLLVSENANTKTTMHFELWKGMNTLNPSYWLYLK